MKTTKPTAAISLARSSKKANDSISVLFSGNVYYTVHEKHGETTTPTNVRRQPAGVMFFKGPGSTAFSG